MATEPRTDKNRVQDGTAGALHGSAERGHRSRRGQSRLCCGRRATVMRGAPRQTEHGLTALTLAEHTGGQLRSCWARHVPNLHSPLDRSSYSHTGQTGTGGSREASGDPCKAP